MDLHNKVILEFHNKLIVEFHNEFVVLIVELHNGRPEERPPRKLRRKGRGKIKNQENEGRMGEIP